MQVNDLTTGENLEAVTVYNKEKDLYEVYITSTITRRTHSISLKTNPYSTLQKQPRQFFKWLQHFFN